jgi:hypothetical protein
MTQMRMVLWLVACVKSVDTTTISKQQRVIELLWMTVYQMLYLHLVSVRIIGFSVLPAIPNESQNQGIHVS